jgi:hypothetical protein
MRCRYVNEAGERCTNDGPYPWCWQHAIIKGLFVPRRRCKGRTRAGKHCWNLAGTLGYCWVHKSQFYRGAQKR